MKHQFLKFSGLSLVISTLALAPVSLAQAQTNDSLSGDNSGDLVPGSGVDFMDLIHQANRAGGMSQSEFSQRQERKINEAAADFLQRRQAALESTQSPSSTATTEPLPENSSAQPE